MTILDTPDVAPSRMLGVYRYLSQARGGKESRETLEKIMMPESLLNQQIDDPRRSVKQVILESVQAGLFRGEDDSLSIHPDFQGLESDMLKVKLSDAIMGDNTRNHDLARSIAWFLSLDPYSAPGDWGALESSTVDLTFARVQLSLNDTRFGQLRDWASFLGFAWTHASSRSARLWLVPDPTWQLRHRMSSIFSGNERGSLSLEDVMDQLAADCPVFEGGRFRNEIEGLLTGREERFLSSSTSCAFLRLNSEGFLRLESRSDARRVFVFDDGDNLVRYSHVTRTG